MKLNYDPVADTIYIRLSEGKKSTKTIEVSEGLNVDYSGKNLIGIEILDASKKVGKKNLDKVTLTLPSYLGASSSV